MPARANISTVYIHLDLDVQPTAFKVNGDTISLSIDGNVGQSVCLFFRNADHAQAWLDSAKEVVVIAQARPEE